MASRIPEKCHMLALFLITQPLPLGTVSWCKWYGWFSCHVEGIKRHGRWHAACDCVTPATCLFVWQIGMPCTAATRHSANSHVKPDRAGSKSFLLAGRRDTSKVSVRSKRPMHTPPQIQGKFAQGPGWTGEVLLAKIPSATGVGLAHGGLGGGLLSTEGFHQ